MGIEYLLVEKDDPQIYRLRYKVFCEEEGYLINPSEKKERDSLDDFAHHFLAIDSGVPVGTIRLIPSRTDCKDAIFGFSMEDSYDLSRLIDKNPWEISRIASLKKYRSRRVGLDLLKTAVLFSKKHGIDYLVATANPETHCLMQAEAIINLAKKMDYYDFSSEISLKKQQMEFQKSLMDFCRPFHCSDLPKYLSFFLNVGMRIIGPATMNGKMKMGAVPLLWKINPIIEPRVQRYFQRPNENIRLR